MADNDTNTTSTEATTEKASSVAEILQKKLTEEQSKAEQYLANWQRTQADFQNYQKRADRERIEAAESAKNAVLLGLLPVVDEFELAIRSLPKEISSTEWVNGLRMIERKLKGFLESYGVTVIEASGKPFDPKYHEALMKADGEDGVVVQELRRGYMVRESVLRPSLVVVGNGQKPEGTRKEQRKSDKETNKDRPTGAIKKEEPNG